MLEKVNVVIVVHKKSKAYSVSVDVTVVYLLFLHIPKNICFSLTVMFW